MSLELAVAALALGLAAAAPPPYFASETVVGHVVVCRHFAARIVRNRGDNETSGATTPEECEKRNAWSHCVSPRRIS